MDPSAERPAAPVVDRLPAPVDLPALVKAMWGLYRRRFWLWFLPTLITYAVIHALQTAALEVFFERGLSDSAQQAVEFIFGIVLVALLGSILVTLLIPAMAATTLGSDISFGESVARARARSRHPLVAMLYALLVGVAMILPPFGFLFLIVGTEILLATVAGPPLLIHVVVHEGVPAREAWQRTRALMRGQWLRVVMNMLTIALGLGIFQFLFLQAAVLMADAVGLRGDLPGAIYLATVQSIFAALAFPLIFLGWWVSYLESRARTDEYSRQQLDEEVAQVAERQAGLTGP